MSARLGVAYVPFLPIGPVSLVHRIVAPEEPAPVTVGDHVRLRRRALGLTQREAAEVIGVTRDALARWEAEPREPDRRNMPGIVRFLGYDPQPAARTFAESIRRTRRTLGLNQPGIAKALGVPTPTLRAWERGLYQPAQPRMELLEARMEALLAERST
jgi:DNA-binding transcriptional regulator YiaG